MSRQCASDLRGYPAAIRTQLTVHECASGKFADAAARWVFRPVINMWVRAPGGSWPLRLIDDAARLVRVPSNVTIASVEAPHQPAELIAAGRGPASAALSEGRWSETRAVLYLHGGAFVACGLNSHRSIAVRLSQTAGSVVLNLAYRMLPLHPISDAIDDAVDAYQWLSARGYRDIVIAGDSAGGYLAFMTAIELQKRGLATPAGIVAMSPLTDLDPEHKACHRNATRCALFSLETVGAFVDHLKRTHETFADGEPLVSPVDSDLSAMPPVQIHAAADELLLQDAELMTERLTALGRQCDLHVWEGQLHAFPAAAYATRAGLEAVAKMGKFIRDLTPATTGAAAA